MSAKLGGVFVLMGGILLFVCSLELYLTPARLPHRPLSQIDIQGHQDLIRPGTDHKWCDGHIKEIVRYKDGEFLIVCRPEKTS